MKGRGPGYLPCPLFEKGTKYANMQNMHKTTELASWLVLAVLMRFRYLSACGNKFSHIFIFSCVDCIAGHMQIYHWRFECTHNMLSFNVKLPSVCWNQSLWLHICTNIWRPSKLFISQKQKASKLTAHARSGNPKWGDAKEQHEHSEATQRVWRRSRITVQP